ncbi:MAG: dockerin type I repeat-containing protein [Ruminococcus sp.]|nr:dockerin type I repeat-containing protein [Ruminococcus sp.]
MKILKRVLCSVTAAVMLMCGTAFNTAAADDIAHDPSRDVQAEGVGNPFNYGERNTPADASTEEIRAINHKMSVQEVKYALYKEIDEHWDLLRVRLGQDEREKVYALFLGIGTRESTLGEGKVGADHETAFSQGFGVSSAHAYGTLQTAVTAFKDCDPTFMPEDNVPEMYQYSLSESTFYDAIISNHMGIRKILHFVEIGINEEGLEGYQVVRGALKGFNTGWCDYQEQNQGYYKDYPDEIIALAHWYYDEGHLYDNEFTWTNDQRAEKYRSGDNNWWGWWGDVKPSMAEIQQSQPVTTTTVTTTSTASETTTVTTTTEPEESWSAPIEQSQLVGDANLDGRVSIADATAILQHIGNRDRFRLRVQGELNADVDGVSGVTANDALVIQKVDAGLYKLSELPLKV